MAIKYPLSHLQAIAKRIPDGREAALLLHGTIEGNVLLVDEFVYREIQQKFPPMPAVRFNIAQLKATADRRPTGYVDFILDRGKIEGDMIVLDEVALKDFREKFPPHQPGRFNIIQLKASADRRPTGYVDFIFAHGKFEGDMVVLDQAALMALREKFPPPPPRPQPPTPTLAELAENFAGAMSGWAQAGFKVVERAEYERRHTACLSCEFWQPDARLGLGKCKKCGCSRVKLWLFTSRCPDKPPRW